jgi:hypothetical protein
MHKMKFGNDAKVESCCKLGTQKPRSPLQALLCLDYRFRSTQGGEKYSCVSAITGHFHARQGNHANPRILYLGVDQISQVPLHLIGDSSES